MPTASKPNAGHLWKKRANASKQIRSKINTCANVLFKNAIECTYTTLTPPKNNLRREGTTGVEKNKTRGHIQQ